MLDRLNHLCENDYLTGYIWNEGGEYLKKKWSEKLPSDAQIIMHIFKCYMDDLLSGGLWGFTPFTDTYYIEYDKISEGIPGINIYILYCYFRVEK